AEWLDTLAQGKVDASVQLDLLDAAGKRKEPDVQRRLQAISAAVEDQGQLAEYRVCLEGGSVDAGRRVFFDNEQTKCTRCHTAEGRGGNAGPVLDGVGQRQPRDYLLESLVDPGAKIAQ